MTSPATWLVDTAAPARLSVPDVGDVLQPLIDAGRVAVTAVTLLEVQQLLMEQGHHWAVKPPDLLVGAVAEIEGLTVIHDDADVDRIADVTAQPIQWVVEAGAAS